jgi:hypothetical protein
MAMNIIKLLGIGIVALSVHAAAMAAAGQVTKVAKPPTARETAAIKRALGKDYADMAPFTVGHADLNGDGRADLVFRSGNSGWCGSAGCATAAVLATSSGFAAKAIDLAYSASDLIVLPATRQGMHDLRFDGGSHVFRWNGRAYR